MNFQMMSALRIYLRRGDQADGKGFFHKLFKRPLSTHLLQQALDAGVTHASLSLGHMGFTKNARQVTNDISELPATTMPVCLELVAPKPLLEQFIREHARQVADATLVMVEGVQILPQVIEGGKGRPHHVEYVKADGVTVSVDHIERIGADEPAAPSAVNLE